MFHSYQLSNKWQKKIRGKSDVECKFYESADDVPDPRELSSGKKNLMVFDDLLREKQNTCESYYVRGRHSNWKKQHGFVIIDLSSKKHDGKYRSGLDEFYIPN